MHGYTHLKRLILRLVLQRVRVKVDSETHIRGPSMDRASVVRVGARLDVAKEQICAHVRIERALWRVRRGGEGIRCEVWR
jgi:hypothetical protein